MEFLSSVVCNIGQSRETLTPGYEPYNNHSANVFSLSVGEVIPLLNLALKSSLYVKSK